MTVTIQTCPTCQGLLIGDSVECPHCGLVLDPNRVNAQGRMVREIDLRKGDTEKPCPQCGEHVKSGLVRCWRCGGFMNEELENRYREMQSSPSPMTFTTSPDELLKRGQKKKSGPEDDFELDMELLAPEPALPATPMPIDMINLSLPSAPGTTEDDSFELAETSTMHFPELVAQQQEELINEDEYKLMQSGMMEFTMPAEGGGAAPAAEDQTVAPPAVVDPASVIPVPEGWDAEQYFQYLRDAWNWHQQLDAAQQGEYAASVQQQTGLPFPPEQISVLFPQEAVVNDAPPVEEAKKEESKPAAEEKRETSNEDHHSVATAGDVLLSAALAEQSESSKRPRARSRIVSQTALPTGSFIVYCPQGHRIQVKEKHRGQTGKCPNCKSLFHVPDAPAAPPVDDANATVAEGGVAGGTADESAGYAEWILDQKLHLVQAAKLKLKPGSLSAEYETVDLMFSDTGLLVATVFKGSGSFRAAAEKKKKPEVRAAYREHLRAKKDLKDLPVPRSVFIPASEVGQIKIAQPANPSEESIFADVPVFGVGMIAVRLPATAEGGMRMYLSFTLSEFRHFTQVLSDTYQVSLNGTELGIPAEDKLDRVRCGHSDTILQVLSGSLDYYKADPKLKPVIVGRKCASCGVSMSEEARIKLKVGSKSGSGIAKAKCPKCKQKMGDVPLYGLPAVPKS